MRVNISVEQADIILEALRKYHHPECNICQFDENHKVKKGTECGVQQLIKKFQRVEDGKASKQGTLGGVVSVTRRKRVARTSSKTE